MPKSTDDADGNLERAENERTDAWGNINTMKIRPKKDGGEGDVRQIPNNMDQPRRKTRRQIEYITSNAKCRNTARKAHIDIYRHANMNQNQQH